MAIDGQTLARCDDALRIHYQPMIRDQFEQAYVLMSNLQKGDAKSIDTSGKFAQIVLQKTIHAAVGAKGDGDALPGKDYARLETTEVYVKSNYGRMEVSGRTMKASRDDRGAVARVFEHESKAVKNSLAKDCNRQLAFGTGTGTLALINGGSQTTTGTVDSLGGIAFATPSSATAETAPTKYIVPGMSIDVGDATTYTTIDVSNKKVSAVADATDFTVESISGADDNGFVSRTDATDEEMMGLRGIIDDGGHLDTLQGITRSTSGNSYWKSQVNDQGTAASPATLTEAMMQTCYSQVERQGGSVDFILTSYGVRDKYSSILTPDKRFTGGDVTRLKGGFTFLNYNDTPLVPDTDCTPHTAYFVDNDTLELYEMGEGVSFMDEDGSILSRTADRDAYEATVYYYANLGVNAPFKNSVLSYVQ